MKKLSPAQSLSSEEALKDRFVLLTSSPVSEDALNAAGEQIETLAKTKWVEICLIRRSSEVEEIGIEIEVSIPLVAGLSSDELLNGMTVHLNYLRQLLEANFTIAVIREDCLWVASRVFNTLPETAAFAAMVPPDFEAVGDAEA
jgi:hypothetical protein